MSEKVELINGRKDEYDDLVRGSVVEADFISQHF